MPLAEFVQAGSLPKHLHTILSSPKIWGKQGTATNNPAAHVAEANAKLVPGFPLTIDMR